MPGGNAIKIGIAVVLLGVAVVVFAVSQRPEQPKSASTKTMVDIICTSCKAHSEVTRAEWEKALAAAPRRERPSTGGGPRTRHTADLPKLVKCPKCGQEAALGAAKCPNSETWYPVTNPDGTPGKCPD